MKKIFLFCAVLLVFSLNVNAQFVDDLEWAQGNCPPHWLYGPFGGCPAVGSGNAHSGVQSGEIPDDTTTEVLLDLGSKTIGEWGLEFWMYIPSGKVGYFNLQGVVPVGAGEWIVGNFFFGQPVGGHAGTMEGYLDDTALGDVDFNFPYDEWFRIVINADITNGISASTWQFGVDGQEVIPAGTPFTNLAGTYPTSLGGIDFFSLDNTHYLYIDDFHYMPSFFPMGVAGIEDESLINFSLYPNPVQKTLQIDTHEQITNVNIYGLQGNILLNYSSEKSIDVSALSTGVYFVEVNTQKGRSTQKFIKQ